MLLKWFLILLGTVFAGKLAWLWLGRIRWFQEHYYLLWIIRIALSLFIAFVSVMVVAFVSMSSRTPALSYPSITYGEFPFRLEYEINGEHFVIEDVLIAKFLESIRGSTFEPPIRRWRTTLQNNGEELRFLLMETENVTIHFTTGRSFYFMGDRNANDVTRIQSFPGSSSSISIPIQPAIIINADGVQRSFYKDSQNIHELLAEYGIILISWEYAPPIENSFE